MNTNQGRYSPEFHRDISGGRNLCLAVAIPRPLLSSHLKAPATAPASSRAAAVVCTLVQESWNVRLDVLGSDVNELMLPLTICDCVFPWCLRANSASPLPNPEGLRCEGNALFKAAAAIFVLLYIDDVVIVVVVVFREVLRVWFVCVLKCRLGFGEEVYVV